jgi:hypothetical protein
MAQSRIVGFTVGVTGYYDPAQARRAHEALLSGGPIGSVRSLIADSWLRSAAAGVDAESTFAPTTLDSSTLAEYRADHPLSRVFPLLYDVLGRAAEDCDSVMAVSDADGQLLWVCGQPSVLRAAERINFVEGATWSEALAGTNAPGTALRLDAPVAIHAAEHFARHVQRWSCAAAPIHDPETHAILGIVDLTGGDDIASSQTVAMIRAAARMAESELARIVAEEKARAYSMRPAPSSRPVMTRSVLRLEGLGRPDLAATQGGRSFRLSPRHSEIAVILSDHPDGLTGDQLAIELYPDDVMSSTLRAEMVRLRGLLGDEVLSSRPYRLTCDTDSDWAAVAAQLAAGRLTEALRIYQGPLLPQSDAPGVVAHREKLERRLRAAILASRQPELMVSWTRSRWGADDLDMWEAQLRALPPGSPLRPLATAEIDRLEAELGL